MVIELLLQIAGLLFIAKVVEQVFALERFDGFVKIVVIIMILVKGG